MKQLQGENRRSPKRQGSNLGLINPLEQFEKWNETSALLTEIEPLVRGHQKELASIGSLLTFKNSLQELQRKMNETVLKEDLKKVQD